MVLVLLRIWGIGGLYLPDTTGAQADGETVLTSEAVPSNHLADAAAPAPE